MERPALLYPPAGAGTRMAAVFGLMHPANALIAAADAMAGLAVAWGLSPGGSGAGLWRLPLAAFLIYAGGMVLDKVCDTYLDQRSSIPRRPVPQRPALWLSSMLLGAGVFAAGVHSREAGFTATALAFFIIAYAACVKRHRWLGPLTLGLCRAGSLLLGMAASPAAVVHGWLLALIPMVYVAAIALVSQEEADGYHPFGLTALSVFAFVVAVYGLMAASLDQWPALIFVGLLTALVWPAFIRAAVAPSRDTIRGATRAGALNLVTCDATLAAIFAGPVSGAVVLLLLPLSRLLARFFPED